jgi:diaminopimelate epimerase
MRLRFTKMQGAGNDFVVLDGVRQRIDLSSDQLRRLADRRLGVGADQILLVEAADRADVDFRYRIFNADGGEVEQCGNGARCFVQFVRAQGLSDKRALRVQTRNALIEPRLQADGEVAVDMGAPRFAPAQVPFDAAGLTPRRVGGADLWPLQVDGALREIVVLSMGNPHAVQVVADVDAAPVATEGPCIEGHARFPQRVNAGFMQVLDRHTIGLRVWERGAGETLACGSGACAAAVAGRVVCAHPAVGPPPSRRFGPNWHNMPMMNRRACCSRYLESRNMPTRNVVLSEHQQQLVEALVQSGRYQNASEVLRDGLRLIAERERREDAKLKALRQAARVGWADVSAGRYADVVDDRLEDFIGQLGRRAAQAAKTAT